MASPARHRTSAVKYKMHVEQGGDEAEGLRGSMVPTSWRVREGGGAMALMPRCYAAASGLVRLVGRMPVGKGVLSDTAALGVRDASVLQRSCLVS